MGKQPAWSGEEEGRWWWSCLAWGARQLRPLGAGLAHMERELPPKSRQVPALPLKVASILCLPLPPPLLSCCPRHGRAFCHHKMCPLRARRRGEHHSTLIPHHTPHLPLPQLLPCHLPTTCRQLPRPGLSSLLSLKYGRLEGVLHLREMVPACWLKTCPTCWVSNPKTPQVLWTPRGNFLWWKWDTE